MEHWYLYVVRARGGSLYTGVTTDVDRRLDEHAAVGGRGARALRGKAPLELVFEREIGERALAQRVEARVKRLARVQKERLIELDPDTETLLAMLAIGASGRTSRSRARCRGGRPDRSRRRPA